MKLYYDFDELGEIDFQVPLDDIRWALESIICNKAGVDESHDTKKLFQYFINTLYPVDELAEEYIDELTDYFEDDAREKLQEINEQNADTLGYVGMKQSDFI